MGIILVPVVFGSTWRSLLLLALLEALFGRQFSWWKVTFFLSFFLLVLLVDCYMVHCSSFASLPSVLLGLFVHLPFSFSASWLCHESWGGVGV